MVGGILALLILSALAFFLYRRHQRQKKSALAPSAIARNEMRNTPLPYIAPARGEFQPVPTSSPRPDALPSYRDASPDPVLLSGGEATDSKRVLMWARSRPGGSSRGQ